MSSESIAEEQSPSSAKVISEHKGLSALALDEQGYALFGVPGPGKYVAPTSFTPQLRNKDAGAHIYPNAPAFSLYGRLQAAEKLHISAEHDKAVQGLASPGPGYDVEPGYRLLEQAEGSTSFGTADRDHERLRFISKQHIVEALGRDSPGPGAYGAASTSSAEPRTCSFGFGHNHTMPLGPLIIPDSPGPVYELPSTLGHQAPAENPTAPQFTFAPHGQRRRGLRRTRSELNRVYISQEHSETEPNYGDLKHMPGPGEYSLAAAAIRFRAIPRFSFPRERRKVLASAADNDSAGGEHSMYALPSCLNQTPSTRFGPPLQPIYFEEEWVEGDGEDMVVVPEVQPQLASMPGPGQYDVSTYAATSSHVSLPAPSFGTGKRDLSRPSTMSWGPGPGTYKSDPQRRSASPAFSMAPALRSDFTLPPRDCGDEPSPAEYDLSKLGTLVNSKVRNPPGVAIRPSKLTRDSFVPRTASPGPVYFPPVDIGKPMGAANFGKKPDKNDKKAKAHEAPRVFFPSAGILDQARFQGCDSPGPCYVLPSPWSTLSKSPSGSTLGRRFSLRSQTSLGSFAGGRSEAGSPTAEALKSRSASRLSDAPLPGPGTYDPKALPAKFRSYSGFSFGTSKRPPLATVAF